MRQATLNFGLLVACALPAACSPTAAPDVPGTRPTRRADAGDDVFLFASFRDPANDGLYAAWSDDGYRWTDLGRPLLRPAVGGEKLIHDPSVCRAPDGTFHMVWTTGWEGASLGYANSKNLIHWSPQKELRLMAHEPTTMNAWAPEVRYDEARRQFMVYWSSTIPGRYPGDDEHPKKRNHRIYYTTTRDFETFAPTKVLFDPGHSAIDAVLVDRPGGTFAFVFKDERRPMRRLRVAFGDAPTGPFTGVTEPFTAHLTEGPTVLRLGDNWVVYYDAYGADAYGAAETSDFRTWTDVSDRVSFPTGHKHGTAFRAPRAVLDRLKQHAAAGPQ